MSIRNSNKIVETIFDIAKNNIITILNSASAALLEYKLLQKIDYLITNEVEFKEIFKLKKDIKDLEYKDIKLPKTCHLIITHDSERVYFLMKKK